MAMLVRVLQNLECFLGFCSLFSVYTCVGIGEGLRHERVFLLSWYVLSQLQEITVLLWSTAHSHFCCLCQFFAQKWKNGERENEGRSLLFLLKQLLSSSRLSLIGHDYADNDYHYCNDNDYCDNHGQRKKRFRRERTRA